jgi:thiamine pyrophosphate-dependent acetolactate synthase large subunit-like protein
MLAREGVTELRSTAGAGEGAGLKPTTGEICIRLLEQYGVDTVFGIPGVHTLEFYRGLAGSPIRHISTAHEQGAAFGADGYGRIAGRPGVCIVISGPGLTNAATGIANAFHDSRPMLVLSGARSTADPPGGGALHELPDQRQLMMSITAESMLIEDPAELPAAFERAWEVFECSRPRPVHIAVPIDVQAKAASQARRLPPANRRPHPSPAVLSAAAAMLRRATQPLMILGGGAVGAGSEALRLAELLGAPILTTVNGKGSVPADHPLSVGARLASALVISALEQADAVLAVGTEFSETDYFFAGRLPDLSKALIRIDIDPAEFVTIQRAAAVELVGDAGEVLGALRAELGTEAGARAGGAARASALRTDFEWWPEALPMLPALEAIAAVLPPDAIVAADSNQLANVANHYLDGCAPRSYMAPIGFGTLGPALPMAIGGQLAAPQRPVLCIIGDGGLLFTLGELVTAARYALPIAVLVWQNRGYQEIRDHMDAARIPRIGTETTARSYLEIAGGCGCAGAAVTVAELGGALRTAWSSDRPTLIELEAPPAWRHQGEHRVREI